MSEPGSHTESVELIAGMEAPCPPEELFSWVEDLARYPSWLGIVERAEPVSTENGGPAAWSVDLRGRLGPFARSKRLRMVRTELVPPTLAVFERQETDGRHHARWLLRVEVTRPPAGRPTGSSAGGTTGGTPETSGSALAMRLHYGGALWGPVLERLLAEEVERSRARLLALVSSPRP